MRSSRAATRGRLFLRILCAVLVTLPVAAQRRRAVTSPTPCSVDAIAQSDRWRRLTFEGCVLTAADGTRTISREDRCYVNAKTFEPLYGRDNTRCQVYDQWAAAQSGLEFVDWLAGQLDEDGNMLYDSPAWECEYVAEFRIGPVAPKQEALSTFRIWDARDPRVWGTVIVPEYVDDSGLKPCRGHECTFTASFKLGCWRQVDIACPTAENPNAQCIDNAAVAGAKVKVGQ